jgi:hypothetical protein
MQKREANSRTERLANIAIALCAIVVATNTVLRWTRTVAPEPTVSAKFEKSLHLANWLSIRDSGLTFGASDAPIQLIEFVDFECPYCASWHLGPLDSLRRQLGDSLAVTLVHLPLAQHRFANQAAVAFECAATLGAGYEFTTAVFRGQDSIGLKPWSQYAREAGIEDTTRFSECRSGPVPPRVISGKRTAERLGIASTPTFLLNGWRAHGPMTRSRLESGIRSVLAGAEPFADPVAVRRTEHAH